MTIKKYTKEEVRKSFTLLRAINKVIQDDINKKINKKPQTKNKL